VFECRQDFWNVCLAPIHKFEGLSISILPLSKNKIKVLLLRIFCLFNFNNKNMRSIFLIWMQTDLVCTYMYILHKQSIELRRQIHISNLKWQHTDKILHFCSTPEKKFFLFSNRDFFLQWKTSARPRGYTYRVTSLQGDQIGRIFAYWGIDYFAVF
jgi:hypothetical protein